MTDLQIVALSLCMEALRIDSENLLWSKLKIDYETLFPKLIDRSRFNRRRKRLQPQIAKVQEIVSGKLEHMSKTMIMDSAPVPVVKLAREKTYKTFKQDYETSPGKGYRLLTKAGSLVTSFMSSFTKKVLYSKVD